MKRTKQERIRLSVLCVIMLSFFSLIVLRLVQLQVVNGKRYSDIVKRQSSSRVSIPASRGMIYDRYGRVVAKDVIGSALCAYPESKKELDKIAAYLERKFELKKGTAKKRYGLGVRKFRYINRRLPDNIAVEIASDAPRGLYINEEPRREYPYGRIGKQIIGFTDIDNKGQSGFELSHNKILAGENGWADFRRDGLRNLFHINESATVKPKRGTSVVLTIDWRLQEIVEEELRKAVDEYNAKDGMAVFIECNSGDILAVAHSDPNEKNPDRPIKCRPVTDIFEPGSVIKAFTLAGLLDEEIIDFNDSIYCEEGKWKVGRRILHDDKELGWLNARTIMELSSNIGLAKLTLELGGENLFDTFNRFGLGSSTKCGLPGESSGILNRLKWSDYNIASLAMGHSIAITPLQVASGMAAIANGGDLMQTNLIHGIVNGDGYVSKLSEPKSIRTVVKESSIDTLHAWLRSVVEVGTATPVNSQSVSIAGKTGTAEIPNPENGRYFKNKFMASFAGFFPYEKPVIAGIVVLKAPRPITYGGYTSGPTFKKIAERYTVSNPDIFSVKQQILTVNESDRENIKEVPNLIGRDLSLAMEIADQNGIKLRSDNDKGKVTWQFPEPNQIIFEGDEVVVATLTETEDAKTMGDLSGLSVRQVSAFLHHKNIPFAVNGNGKVVKQSIKPGADITSQSFCFLDCKPDRRSKR